MMIGYTVPEIRRLLAAPFARHTLGIAAEERPGREFSLRVDSPVRSLEQLHAHQ